MSLPGKRSTVAAGESQTASEQDVYTLPLKLSAEEKAALDKLRARMATAGVRSLTEVVKRALALQGKAYAVIWPARKDRRRKPAKPAAPPPPVLPERPPVQALVAWLDGVERVCEEDPESMTLERWALLLALYQAARDSMPNDFARWWKDMDRHRKVLDEDREEELANHRVLRAVYNYEAIRKEWGAKWRATYSRVDRADLAKNNPAALHAIRTAEARRQQARRQRQAKDREIRYALNEETFCDGPAVNDDDDLSMRLLEIEPEMEPEPEPEEEIEEEDES
jgi:hypothetical protein